MSVTSGKVTLINVPFFLTATKSWEGVWPLRLTSAGCADTFQLPARRLACLQEQTPCVSDPLCIAEPGSHLPVQLGDIIINFITNFILYTSK